MKTNEIREKYLEFFESKGCVRRPSDVLVPRWDPSVLFTPAGMNQFKDHFLGRCKLEFTRATTCQKCLRTGDIDNVGRTSYHHTFFEMLGNFSFGDYFKREAIHWAWEFLTDKKWMGINPELLSATVYLDDQEAANIWLNEIKLPSERLSYLDEEDNFWPSEAPSKGPDGVCGPCSEIYYKTPNGEVEIWNLVFTQFNRVGNPPDNLRPLPSKNIDTGMGLERVCSVLQNVETNYHIDILRPLVEASGEVCSAKYNGDDLTDENGRRMRRIADHVRACTFAIHENVYPGNKEEKYVIRRLLRRAVLDGVQMGMKKPFLYQLVPVVADLMKVPYPELTGTVERVQGVIKAEEENFISTIDTGLRRIEHVFDQMSKEKRNIVRGTDSFEMYQTYGFPPELFEVMAGEKNFGFDWDGFQKEMEHHGEISGTTEKNLLFKHDPLESIKKTNDPAEFLGYKTTFVENAKVLALVKDGKLIDSAETADGLITLVLDKTPFYGEKGGQVGDTGTIFSGDFSFNVENSKYDGEFIVHDGKVQKGTIHVGAVTAAQVDQARRMGISRAHSATHLLHFALRKHLGAHAEQQGSKVDNDILRFDFTNHKGIERDLLLTIEKEVNSMILESIPVTCDEMPLEEARKVGAMMLFGEKYPDIVRVVRMGGSKELCGGTHLTNTNQIGFCKIIAEESVSAGTRRITALTGMEALARVQQMDNIVAGASSLLRVPNGEILTRLESVIDSGKKLRKQLENAARKQEVSVDSLIKEAKEIAGTKLILWKTENADQKNLRSVIDQIFQKTQNIAVLFANVQEGKVTVLGALSKDLVTKGINAAEWIKKPLELVQGRGNGRPDFAQGGGKNPDGVEDAFKAAQEDLASKLA